MAKTVGCYNQDYNVFNTSDLKFVCKVQFVDILTVRGFAVIRVNPVVAVAACTATVTTSRTVTTILVFIPAVVKAQLSSHM